MANGNLIRKVLNKTYSFPKSKGDMEILRKLSKAEPAETDMEGGPDFRYYAAVFNICTEFGEQVLDSIPALGTFNNRVVDMQEEYMPSGPPMSPVTKSFFSAWMALDAPIDDELSLGSLFLRYVVEKNTMVYAQKTMENLNESCRSLYQVTGGDLKRTVLWDILEKRELEARIGIVDYSVASYNPRVGDVWYTRILPPPLGEDRPWVVFGT